MNGTVESGVSERGAGGLEEPRDGSKPPAESPPPSAADLARRIAAGDGTAETELVERYSRGVLYLLRRLTRSSELAEDLHQETFRVVLERLRGRGLAEPDKLSAFLRETAKNLHRNEWRKGVRRGVEDDAGDARAELYADPGTSPYARLARAEEARLVRRLLGELPSPRDREILYRFYLGDEDKERLCRDLEISSLHFNRVLHRARRRFRRIVQESLHGRPERRVG